MKTYVSDYHQNDQTNFLHSQIQYFSAHALIPASGYKTPRAYDFSTTCTHLEISLSECMSSEMIKFAVNPQELPLNFVSRKSVVFGVSLQLLTLCFILC